MLSGKNRKETRFPRIRGDVPIAKDQVKPSFWFSPHTRGCSGNPLMKLKTLAVFPAYAGMFRGGKTGEES